MATKPIKVRVNRFRRAGNRFLVILDIGCTTVGGLTGAGKHRDLDRRTLALPRVVDCKQHGWVNEDDESAEFDVTLEIPPGIRGWVWRRRIVQRSKARAVCKAVDTILDDLLWKGKGR